MFTSQGYLQDKTLDDLSGVSYYIVAKGSAYTFHMFDGIYTYEETQRLIKDLTANTILTTGDKILVLPASSAERLLALFPHLKPISDVLSNVEWKKLPEKTQVTMMRNYIKSESEGRKSNFSSDYAEVTKNLARIEPETPTLANYIDKVQKIVAKVRKQLDKMNEYQYRYAEVDEAFTKLISKRLAKDPQFISDSSDLREFVQIDNQARKVFPILGTYRVEDLKAEHLTRYVESDWAANSHEV